MKRSSGVRAQAASRTRGGGGSRGGWKAQNLRPSSMSMTRFFAPPPAEVKAAFLKLLDRPRVPLEPQLISSAAIADGVAEEVLTIASERKADGSIERVPLQVLRPSEPDGRYPAVIVLHGTSGNKASQTPFMIELVRRGIYAIAIDARYHGDRSGGAEGAAAYVAAITRAWRTPAGAPAAQRRRDR